MDQMKHELLEPKPGLGEDVKHFDVVSDMGPISPQLVLNALETAYKAGFIPDLPLRTGAQPYCISFEDVNVV